MVESKACKDYLDERKRFLERNFDAGTAEVGLTEAERAYHAAWNTRATPPEAERGEEMEKLRAVYKAARGLSHGADWNKGIHAKAYRRLLMDAVNAVDPPPTESAGEDKRLEMIIDSVTHRGESFTDKDLMRVARAVRSQYAKRMSDDQRILIARKHGYGITERHYTLSAINSFMDGVLAAHDFYEKEG